ncbi:hypothetical protein BDP27DRAFT_1434229 [Rhodocollybia butyracea]|uniref:Uncharacterized protein n=1 Tax=Rhodocollybia butyracea TaxID=206335 RepID=A0A9P5P5M4_9AGAR|nr:hypothetical protein BDP27DRAFT_1434229 [Rhodocollybia butyracea]
MPTVLNTIKKEAHAIQPDPTRRSPFSNNASAYSNSNPNCTSIGVILLYNSVFVTMDAVGNTDFSDNDNDGEFSAFDESSISPISLTTHPTPLSSIGIVDVPVYSPAYDSAHMLGLKGMKENEGFARYRFGWI